MQYLLCISAGILVSLSGSLPLGNLNITAMHLGSRERLREALWFAFGVVLIEMLYLRLTLEAVDSILQHKNLFIALQWMSVLLLLVLGAGSFLGLRQKNTAVKNVVIDNKLPRFSLGLLMSALNPMQLPFWAGWSVYLVSRNLLIEDGAIYTVFTLSAGLGTLLALLAFILAGRRLSGWLLKHQRVVLALMGGLFTCLAIYQAVILL